MTGLATPILSGASFSGHFCEMFLTGIAGEIGYTCGLLGSSFVGSLPSGHWAGLRLSTKCHENEV
jgi:hypothetical protein